ncbi:non-ribosomal peptide synthetase [Serratia silvae]|uniref:Non-ribosomal peptide synthetase n=1 Tax=Serratia silvae TaxID=2824122 RepID=A0ABT0KDG8_9GAMM|nr:non-ribosomal peptide synthetase [Serratia silvae]MCL1029794.1 non-ribosomal peptide synthetase [Serratia silvae]
MSHTMTGNKRVTFTETGNAAELILQSIIQYPEKTAQINGEIRMDYAEFERHVVAVQQQLTRAGVERNDVVGLLLHRDRWLIPAMIATLALGATFVPLDPAYPLSRLERYVDVAKPKMLLAHPEESVLAEKLNNNVIYPSLTTIGKMVCVARQCDEVAYILFTSGSTGQPKGVSISHQALHNFLIAIADRLEVQSSHVFLAHTTVAFDISILELLLPLSVGGTVLLASNDDVSTIEGILPLIEKSHFVQATPSLWKILWATDWRPDSSVTLLSGGEELPIGLAKKLNQTCGRLWNLYGPTEATIWTSCECVERDADYISIGEPLANTQLHVLNEALEPCEHGELYISGHGLAQGYHGNREGTEQVFITHPKTGMKLYRSGDRVRLREQGRIEWLGRGNGEIKIRGNRIGVSEIETELENIPGIAGAVVLARRFEGRGDDMLTAYIVSQAPLTKASLENMLGKRLPDYMVPDLFVVLPEFSLQPNGKFDKKSLPDPSWNNTLHHHTDSATSAQGNVQLQAIAATICQVFATALGCKEFDETSSFFDRGGNSALALISSGIISAKLKRKIPVSLIISGENPNAIAKQILQHT